MHARIHKDGISMFVFSEIMPDEILGSTDYWEIIKYLTNNNIHKEHEFKRKVIIYF